MKERSSRPRPTASIASFVIRAICIALVSGSLWGPGADAQYHDATYVTGSVSIDRVTGSGSVAQLFDNPAATHGLTMDVDNRLVVFGEGSTAFGLNAIARIDPTSGTVTTVLANPRLLYGPLDLVVNPDGDYVFTNRFQRLVTPTFAIFDIGLFKLSRTSGAVSTIATTIQVGAASDWSGGLAVDIDTGHYVVQDRALQNGAPLLEISERGRIATLATGFTPRFSITQDIRTGDWYSAAGRNIEVLRQGTSVPTTLFSGSGFGIHSAIAFDRASAAVPRVVSIARHELYYVDPTTPSITTVAMAPTTSTPWEMTFVRGRNLSSVKTGGGRYDLRLSFPGEGGRGYAIAMSAGGVRPGIPLPDGRSIALAADGLTLASLLNLLPGIWQPGPLVLDPAGEAVARLDVSGIAVTGIPIWVAAIVVDGGGVGTVGDPIVIRLP